MKKHRCRIMTLQYICNVYMDVYKRLRVIFGENKIESGLGATSTHVSGQIPDEIFRTAQQFTCTLDSVRPILSASSSLMKMSG